MNSRLFLTTAIASLAAAAAMVYECSPDGEPYTIEAALAVAGPGDTVSLADGLYREPIVTMTHGEDGNPLVIEGGRGAVISAFSGDRSLMWSQKVVDIRHSWITLRGFTVDGHLDDQEVEESFVDKCIWIEGKDKPTTVAYRGEEVETSLIGFRMHDMAVRNCGMECVRLRNWVTNSVITDNFIEDCGIYDFRFQFDGKIGEAIYIGTSSNQWTDGPDGSNYNLVSGNTLIPRGNECVDIKEGATMNVVERNDCAEQLDEESGCYDSRGNGNIFRYNSAAECSGAGIRLGGHVIDDFVYGVENDVYGNHFESTGRGSIKARQVPQGFVCGNTCDGDCEIDEEGDEEIIENSWDQECPDNHPRVRFIDDVDTNSVPTSATVSTSDDDTETAPTTTGASYLGCYADNGNAGRIMKYVLKSGAMTTEMCEETCAGYKFFGMQYGHECWCGGADTDHLKHGASEECNYECEGDNTQICGGFWSMSVYEY